jgi:plasmid stability protein
MDTTIRNLNEAAYRELKARAAIEGKSIGEAMTAAIRAYVASSPRNERQSGRPSILDVEPIDLGPGSEHLSEEVDEIVYGLRDDA